MNHVAFKFCVVLHHAVVYVVVHHLLFKLLQKLFDGFAKRCQRRIAVCNFEAFFVIDPGQSMKMLKPFGSRIVLQ